MTHSTQSAPSEDLQLSSAYGNMPASGQNFNIHPLPQPSPVLPPFSSIQTMGPPVPQRYQFSDSNSQRVPGKYPPSGSKRHGESSNVTSADSGSKRHGQSSNVTSADSSDLDEENGELPAQGLLAPWEVLRGLADATEHDAKVR